MRCWPAPADDGEDGDLARARLAADPTPCAPHPADLEVVLSVLRQQAGAGLLDARRVWELRDNLTPYDAAYVAVAETLGCPLLTADGRLGRAPGLSCAVEVLAAR